MKVILVICDGMADRPVPELGGRTPLEVARKPRMDRIAELGECGIMDPIAPGVRAGSDTSHMAILGYDPFVYYKGRGPIEAAGLGIDVKPGDVAFRVNLATVENGIVVDRRAGRIREGVRELEETVREIARKFGDEVEIIFKTTGSYRAALVLRGRDISHEVKGNDPKKPGKPLEDIKPTKDDPRAIRTARLLNEFLREVHEALENHPMNEKRRKEGKPPANCLLLRGAGIATELESFEKKYGLRGACIAAANIVKGVCKLAGMDVIDVPGATGGLDSNIRGKAEALLENLERYDLFVVNIKGTDEASHDGDIEGKIRMIERIDSEFLGTLLDGLDLSDCLLVLTSDHTTPLTARDHMGDPTPIAICSWNVRRDDVRRFDERSCAKGGLNRIRALDIMNIVTNLLGISEKFGA